MSLALSSRSFLTLTEGAAYLQQVTSDAVLADAVTRSLNAAVAWMARRTNRILRATTCRKPVTMATCCWSAAGTSVSVASTVGLYVDDEVVGVGLAAGSRIKSIDSSTGFTLDRAVESGGNNVDLTFGSEPFRLNGNDKQSIYVTEYPLNTLIGAYQIGTDGTRIALDVTAARIQSVSGLIYLPNARFPRSAFTFMDAATSAGESMSIEVDAHVGYMEPTGAQRGHPDEWEDLCQIQRRSAQVFFQDWVNTAGRSANKSVAGQGFAVPDYTMPADIESAIARYARLG